MNRTRNTPTKRPEQELQIEEAKTRSLRDLFANITTRANLVISAQKEPDEVRRNLITRLLTQGRMLIGKAVPFVPRPRSLTELLRAEKLQKFIRAALRNAKDNTNNSKGA